MPPNDYWKKLKISDPEQYKQKRRDQNQKYIEKKFKEELKHNKKEMIEKVEKAMIPLLNKLTRILYDHQIPKRCENCGATEDLHLHHIRYTYPIDRKDIKRLCRQCHVLEHQKTRS